MKTIKRLLAPSKKSFWIAVFWTILIVYYSFKTPSVNPKFDLPFADKLVHFCFYFGFVFLWYHYFYFKKKDQNKDRIVLVITAILIGVVIEFCQGYFTTNRQADVFDALANATGGISGIFIANIFLRSYYSKE